MKLRPKLKTIGISSSLLLTGCFTSCTPNGNENSLPVENNSGSIVQNVQQQASLLTGEQIVMVAILATIIGTGIGIGLTVFYLLVRRKYGAIISLVISIGSGISFFGIIGLFSAWLL